MEERKVIKIIKEYCEKNNEAAYFESVCGELYGDFNEENSKKLEGIVNALSARNLIIINGDRLCIKEPELKGDFIVVGTYENVKEQFESVGLELEIEQIDVGHGCNLCGQVCKILGDMEPLVGMLVDGIKTIAEVKTAYEACKWGIDTFKISYYTVKERFNKIKEVKEEHNKLKSQDNIGIYLGDELLLAKVIDEILNNYKLNIEDINYLKLVDKSKVKVGALGYYAIYNHNYDENSLEGSPCSINYYAIEFSSEKLEGDSEIVRCEILSNGTIEYFKTINVNLDNNF